jgi:anti-sigma regulatory factor (Ser/Thr protein kinase)
VKCDASDIELRIMSEPRWLCVVRAALDTALAKLGVVEAVRGLVTLAVDEAVTNVIRHGYEGRSDKPIWVRFAAMNGASPAFRIVIDDEGRQVDPDKIRGRDLENVRPGGLGVHIIRQVMDEVAYTARPEGGMRLTMVKHYCRAANDASSNNEVAST